DKIDPTTMKLVSSFTAPSEHWSVWALTYDGKYIYAGYFANYGYVDKIDPSTMTLVSSFTPPSGYSRVNSLTQNIIIGNNYAVFK
ncbi:MAG: hypothetical protein ACP5MW_06765, partial [Thermoplasmata archaeon]